MTLEAKYFSPTTPGAATFTEDVSSAIRLGSITGLSGEAELGAVGEGNIVLDDPDSTIGHLSDGIVGLKQFFFNETACPAGNQRLWTGYVADRRYHRGTTEPSGTPSSLILDVAREIDVTLQDVNAFLSFRVFPPTADDPTSDFDRPAETDLQRVAGLLTDVDFLSTTLFDIGYIPTTGGVAMDAKDYTGQRPIDVLNDCAQASGRNFFVLYDETGNQYVLWYDVWTTDGSSTLAYDSPLRLMNFDGGADGVTTFAVSPNAVEVKDPSRVIAAIRGTGNGVKGYETKAATADTFAWRDGSPLSAEVTTQAKMDALLTRYLNENDTEDSRISCTVQLPASKVTSIHEGMRLEVYFTHLPSVTGGYTWTRVLQRTIRQDQQTADFYWLDLELSPLPFVCPDATASQTFAVLNPTTGNDNAPMDAVGSVAYCCPGRPCPVVPSPNFVGTAWRFHTWGTGGSPDMAGDCVGNHLRIIVVGDGTLTIPTVVGEGTTHIRARLQHNVGGSPVTDEEQLGESGDTFIFTIDTEEMAHCINWVDIEERSVGDPCGGNAFGYGGDATWFLT